MDGSWVTAEIGYCRRQTLYEQSRPHFGEVFRKLAAAPGSAGGCVTTFRRPPAGQARAGWPPPPLWVGRSFLKLAQRGCQGVQKGIKHAVIGPQPADEDPPHTQVLKAAMQFRALELRVARIGQVPLETMEAVAGRSRSGEKAALTIMGVG